MVAFSSLYSLGGLQGVRGQEFSQPFIGNQPLHSSRRRASVTYLHEEAVVAVDGIFRRSTGFGQHTGNSTCHRLDSRPTEAIVRDASTKTVAAEYSPGSGAKARTARATSSYRENRSNSKSLPRSRMMCRFALGYGIGCDCSLRA